jgi:hypothetical protein
MGAELFDADWWTDYRKPIVAFRNFAKSDYTGFVDTITWNVVRNQPLKSAANTFEFWKTKQKPYEILVEI